MKQCIISEQHSSLLASATEDELLVSQILLELENLFMVSELSAKFIWGRKKRRSSLPEASSYSPEQPTSRPASVHRNEKEVEGRTPQVKAEEECPAAKTSSPTTPLSFLPSESDEKSKHSSKKCSKKRNYNNMIEELMECGDLLRGELEKVRNYYNELRTYNSELKAMKLQVLKTCAKKEGSPLETIGFLVDPTQHYLMTMLTHQHPLIADPTAQKFQHPFGPITAPQTGSFFNGIEPVNHVGPAKIPDLNLSAEDAFGVDTSQPLDVDRALADKRARFAEARRTRRGIIKIKSMRSACGIKLPRIRV